MKYVIHAYEQSYGGLHGIDTTLVIETDNYLDAIDEACCASRGVMSSYAFIEENLREQACFYCGVEEYDEENEDLERAYEDAVEESIAYSIWVVKEECPYTVREIDQMIADDLEGFVEEFCIIFMD